MSFWTGFSAEAEPAAAIEAPARDFEATLATIAGAEVRRVHASCTGDQVVTDSPTRGRRATSSAR